MQKRKEKNTEHPHIKKIIGPAGVEQAVIAGTGLRVWTLIDYYQMGASIEDLLNSWDYLTPAQIFDALAYYHDHKDEIDELRKSNVEDCQAYFLETKIDEYQTVS